MVLLGIYFHKRIEDSRLVSVFISALVFLFVVGRRTSNRNGVALLQDVDLSASRSYVRICCKTCQPETCTGDLGSIAF